MQTFQGANLIRTDLVNLEYINVYNSCVVTKCI